MANAFNTRIVGRLPVAAVWPRLKPLVESKKRGDVIRYDEVTQATGEDDPHRFRGAIERELARRAMVLGRAQAGIGWPIETGRDTVRNDVRERIAQRNLRKRVAELGTVGRAELENDAERTALDHKMRGLARAIDDVRATRAEAKKIAAGAPPPLPRLKAAE